MNSKNHSNTSNLQNVGVGILLIVGLLVTLSSFMLLLGSGPETFEEDTGVSWSEISENYPTVAAQFTMSQTGSITANLALGLLAIAVTFFALRTGERWAWFALWILPASMIPGTMLLAQSDTAQSSIAFIGGAFISVAVFGLLLSFPRFFLNQPAIENR